LRPWTTYPGEIHVRPNALDLESDTKSIFGNTSSKLLAAVKWLERYAMGLVAIPTKRNSVVISIAQKSAKCRNRFFPSPAPIFSDPSRRLWPLRATIGEASSPKPRSTAHAETADAGDLAEKQRCMAERS
jgi:hypothetical protein